MGLSVKEAGVYAEEFFEDLLSRYDIPFEYVDTWFDYKVLSGVRVEIKSCKHIKKNGFTHRQRYTYGNYEFKDDFNHSLACDEDVWVCFIVRIREGFLLQGFVRGSKLDPDKNKYTQLQIARLNPISFREWLLKLGHADIASLVK